jgi:hypothetical protein
MYRTLRLKPVNFVIFSLIYKQKIASFAQYSTMQALEDSKNIKPLQRERERERETILLNSTVSFYIHRLLDTHGQQSSSKKVP